MNKFSNGPFILCPDQTKSKSTFKFIEVKNELSMSHLVGGNI